MRLPTRTVAASRLRFALGVVVLAVLLAGSSVTAAADPTGSPSSTASSAASPTPSTDTPTPTPIATATAAATSAATTSDVTPPSISAAAEADAKKPRQVKAAKVPVAADAGIVSLQDRLPAKLRQFGALAATTQQQARVAAAAPALEDDRLALSVISRCAAGSAETSVDIAVLLLADVQLSVSYVVRDGENAQVAQGSFALAPGSNLDFDEFTVVGLSAGSYHLDLFAGNVEAPTSSLDFDVVGCVTTTITCQAITFSNPASNPALELNVFGDDPDGGSSDVTFRLSAGAARTVRTGRTTIDWFAGAGVATDLSQIIALAGAVTGASIPQGCGDPSSSVRVGCKADGGSAKVTVSIDHPADESAEWVILDTFRTEVASGHLKADGRTSGRFTAKLRGAGRYEYLMYLNGTGDVLESFDVTVRACAQVGLADTGASGGAPAGVLVGLLLVTTGTGLARRFRQESCSHLAKR